MFELIKRKNIVLIGMASCGKSTLGVLIAKELGMSFIDTDLIMQQTYGKPLWKLLDDYGSDQFIKKESHVICSLDCTNTCISTGGSAVYSEKAMTFLKQGSDIVFINLSHPNIEKRLANTDITSRGIVIENGKTLLEVYNERKILYSNYADYTIEADDKSLENLVADIVRLFTKESDPI
ncbi:shikimate kinase [Paenibacillus sp. GSMTC-2017]|uniref:shikimate kinase n=1 Tax=Paenibacillus sp. GSMTC-2017 TaxID=2794350 RepID=UPI0018D88F59|nr:shikimate kinase [Paenibacillus sp. GSMTC-2017]MBH5316271.1 shikimate kinase [Paenibacillus sp. GSMTC-2017]